jgi:cobalamin biosynthesis protein CobT
MLSLVSTVIEELNFVKGRVTNNGPEQGFNIGVAVRQPTVHPDWNQFGGVRMDTLIEVSDSEEDGEKDEDSDEDADEDVDEDSEEDSEEDSDEDSEENVDEDVDDNGEKSGDLDIDDSTDGEDEVHVGVEELDDRESTFVLSEVEDCSILGESPAPEDESDRIKTVVLNDDTEHSENPFLEISTTNRPNSSFDIKSIDILTLDDTANDESDLKKLSLNKLRTLAVTKGLIQDASRLKKHELLKLLEKE